MLKLNGLASFNNPNQTNGKLHEHNSHQNEISSKSGLNLEKHQNANASLTHNGLKRRTETDSKIKLQENLLKTSLSNYNNSYTNLPREYNTNNNYNYKENRNYTPPSFINNNNNKNKKPALHERNKSLGDSHKGFSFLENNNPSSFSTNNINSSNNAARNAKGPKPIIPKIFTSKSKAGRQYDGTTKTNQDSFLIKNKLLNLDNYGIFGVFDGHGSHGHFVSNMIKLFFSEFFSKPELYISQQFGQNTKSSVNGNFPNKNGNGNKIMNKTNFANAFNFNIANSTSISGAWKDLQSTAGALNSNLFSSASVNSASGNFIKEDFVYEKLKERNFAILKNSFSLAESSIAVSKYEVNFSGSTCIMLFLIENKLICANAGDSRAILVSQKGNADAITELSRDHKPELKDELYRITRLNGRVDRFNDNGIKTGPYRVWLKTQNYPGLAMSRSIGDLVAGSVGVICEPEIFECELTDKSKFIVIASDGIWEFLSNERVADIVNPFYYANLDVNGAAEKLVEEATKCWRRVLFLFILLS